MHISMPTNLDDGSNEVWEEVREWSKSSIINSTYLVIYLFADIFGRIA